MSSAANLFRRKVLDYYRKNGRHEMLWRIRVDPYWIFISEVMLQQTQVPRVAEKFPPFVEAFPDFHALAGASFASVLTMWQGLGYNRRAKYLHRAASAVCGEFNGNLPADEESLLSLPGIGKNTAASIRAFAFNEPVVFIETNIRRAYIHEFFPTTDDDPDRKIADTEIYPLIEETLDRKNPREWYWALMDYGTDLKRRVPNPNRRSRSYLRQSTFEGSNRQLRGRILRILGEGALPFPVVAETAGFSADRVQMAIDALRREGFVEMSPDGELSIHGGSRE